MAKLAEPASTTMLAAKVGLARQKVNYRGCALGVGNGWLGHGLGGGIAIVTI